MDGEVDHKVDVRPRRAPVRDRPESDEELMARFRDGEASAFDDILDRHKRAIYAFLAILMRTSAGIRPRFEARRIRIGSSRPDVEFRAPWSARPTASRRLLPSCRRSPSGACAPVRWIGFTARPRPLAPPGLAVRGRVRRPRDPSYGSSPDWPPALVPDRRTTPPSPPDRSASARACPSTGRGRSTSSSCQSPSS
jgi:hypothetical protein